MAWTEEKVFRELDRPRLVAGVRDALLQRPDKSFLGLCERLCSGALTEHQVANALRVLPELETQPAVSAPREQVLQVALKFADHHSMTVRREAFSCVFRALLHGAMYRSLRLSIASVRQAMDLLQSADSALFDELAHHQVHVRKAYAITGESV